ncbi:MAG: hypothetical protein QOI33_3975 [Mycobacterium sp.]|nr:hypothetical protein [Mycobacterium sp.]
MVGVLDVTDDCGCPRRCEAKPTTRQASRMAASPKKK